MLLDTTPLVQNLTPVEAQDLLNYASGRLRSLAIAITNDYGLISRSPTLKERCWSQFKQDLNTTLILYGSMSLLHPGKIWAPVFLDHVHRLLINGGINDFNAIAEGALNRPMHGFDVFPPDASNWWTLPPGSVESDCTPLNLSAYDIVEAWKKQEKRTTWYNSIPPMLPSGFQEWRLKPLHDTFKTALDVFEITCAKFDGLLEMSLDGKPVVESPDLVYWIQFSSPKCIFVVVGPGRQTHFYGG
ncbi:hypothetical protein CC1G_12678 [Coprinopsis cinerea okayama7|uniref:Uncharacterized protein n=1 Tax=Coprinopsis cinerea (strain Okayama-7 / 130 / ATCC MYA-4618 / FGSC 9003) TaxID=240176 RepID=A8PHM9_COPC7|nr:hypothetical protein CC1G_12678 [Coprinopsis cinerea okayama7\|eukprot:XP_001841438.2 hypothetical protein CC1G_12678 [Coprinopsis cinerea okayama7\